MTRISKGAYGQIVSSDEWNGVRAGQSVKIRPQYLGSNCQWVSKTRWTIVGFTTNLLTGAQKVDIWGGKKQHVRSVAFEAIDLASVR